MGKNECLAIKLLKILSNRPFSSEQIANPLLRWTKTVSAVKKVKPNKNDSNRITRCVCKDYNLRER